MSYKMMMEKLRLEPRNPVFYSASLHYSVLNHLRPARTQIYSCWEMFLLTNDNCSWRASYVSWLKLRQKLYLLHFLTDLTILIRVGVTDQTLSQLVLSNFTFGSRAWENYPKYKQWFILLKIVKSIIVRQQRKCCTNFAISVWWNAMKVLKLYYKKFFMIWLKHV